MKIPALLTIAALSCGAVFAQGTEPAPSPQQSATTTDQGIARGNRVDGTAAKTRSSGAMMGNSGAMAKDSTMSPATTTAASSDTMTARTHRGAHKVKHAAKHAGHKAKVAMSDTRRMGASGSDMRSGSRQDRMDAAYDNWKSRQK
jgi:hypothetical protein